VLSRRLVALLVSVAVVMSGCALLGGGGERTYKARFSRAIQVFPGGKVRVLGVDVGVVEDVSNVPGAVEVTFVVEDPEVQLPADVEASIVPASLLGERYIQLFPAYQGGPTLRPGATIPLERTAVPSEPDELLRSLQDYLGAIDPEAVNRFVTNAAAILEGNGEELNALIHNAANVIGTLAAKRDDLAKIIVEFERLTAALATRKAALARVIKSYNVVIGTITSNRAALEGSIQGLNEMSLELAALLSAHRDTLGQDIDVLTMTGRTLRRNIDTFARTGHWASRLFHAAKRAVDVDKEWLRLNGQEQQLGALIIMRIEERLKEICEGLGLPECATHSYWATNVPALFCYKAACPTDKQQAGQSPQEQLSEAISHVPELANSLLEQFREITCADADDKEACLKRKEILIACAKSPHPQQCLREKAVKIECLEANDVQACLQRKKDEDVKQIVDDLLEETLGNPLRYFGGRP
jgi:phospholipid/cholesterol/gamma-HCH transport system substrate-binding protein